MRLRQFFIVFSLIFIIIMACAEHEIEPFKPALTNGRVIGSIHGVITDYCTQTHFDSAAVTVSWIVDGELMTMPSQKYGYYTITDLPPGDYIITFDGPETHALGRFEVHIPTLEELGEAIPPASEDWEHSVAENISLYGRNAGLQGLVYKRDDAHNISVAAGVSVVVDYSRRNDRLDFMVYPSKYTVVTDANGFFSFDSLPGAPKAQLSTLPYTVNNMYYDTRKTSISLEQNAVVHAGQIMLNIDTPAPFLTFNNFKWVDDFAVDGTVQMTFSKAMETGSFTYHLQADLPGDWTTIECDTTWTGDTQLAIKPYKVLPAGTNMRLSLQGVSLDQHAFQLNNTTFSTQPGIAFVYTNVERAQGIFDDFPLAANIELTFSMPVNTAELYLYDMNDPSTSIYVHGNTSINNTMASYDPADNLEPNRDYALQYEVSSAIPGNSIMGLIEFTTVATVTPPARVSNFRLTNTAMPIDFNTRDFTFRWDTVADAEYYLIFARDSRNNTDHVLISDITADDAVTWMSTTVTLLDQFDYFDADAIVTPFLHTTTVTFAIYAWNDAGFSPVLESGPYSDNTDPALTLSTQSSTADNSAGAIAKTITLRVTSSEPLTALTIDFVDSNNDTVLLPSTAATSTLDADLYGATIRVVIPANTNVAGDRIRVTGTDTSANSTDPAESILLN